MIRNLTYGTYTFRAVNSTAAGTTAVNGTGIDLVASFGGPFTAIRAICFLGTLTATQVTSLKLQGSDTSISTGFADMVDANGNSIQTAAAADGDSNKMLIVECYRPMHRYVRPVVNRGTANAAIDAVVIELFVGAFEPITSQDSTVSQFIVRDYGK